MTSRSPSPASAPPVASTPGPRATALQKLYTDAIAHVLKTCSYTTFAACFPTPARHIASSMRGVHEQFTTKIGASAHDEFAAILENRDVVAGLNELDALVEDARRRKARGAADAGGDVAAAAAQRIIPHTLQPMQLYMSHLAPSLRKHASEMAVQQSHVQEENVELLDRVMKQRAEIASLMRGLDAAVADLDASVAALHHDDELEDVKEEVRDVDEQMRLER